VQDGSALLRVQAVQEGVDNHRGHPLSLGGAADSRADPRRAQLSVVQESAPPVRGS
jgi:hypothetical protein